MAQSSNVVSGKVTDTNGHSLPGVVVVIKGSNTGTTTNAEGKYSITKVSDNDILLFSFLGMGTKEIAIQGQLVVNVVLEDESIGLSDVIVIGYGVQKKSDLTGAVTSVKSSDIGKMSVATSDQVLQGRAAGVTVTSNSGSPGTPVQVRVRGIGTINNSSPLYVVDGFPIDDISFLNSADIASMEILKDASSTAIYGARGANGVILITTKSGKDSGAPIINVDLYTGVSNMWKTPELLNASQWAMLKNEALTNGGMATIPELDNYQNLGEGTDWIKEVSRPASTRNVNFSIAGGNANMSYFISANNYLQEGIIKKSDFSRTSVRINTSIKAKKWLTLGENLTIEQNKTHRINEGDEWSAILIEASTIDPVTPVRLPNGNFAPSDYVDMNNPVAKIDRTNGYSKAFRTVGNVFGEVHFTKDLIFKSTLGLNYVYGNDYNFAPIYHISGAESNDVNSVSRGSNEGKSWSWSNYFTYAKKIGKQDFSVMAGIEATDDYSEWFGTRATALPKEFVQLRYIDNAANRNASNSNGSMSDKKMQSYFGRVNYSYANKYLVTANIRRDGSSVFGPDRRYGTFPSFSAGWKINQEDFLINNSTISILKLRAGWGKIGNDKIPEYQFYTLAKSGQRYPFGDIIQDGISFPGIGNSELQWEETATTNIGLDLGFWSNKLNVTAEYYIRKTSNMLMQSPVLAHVGLQDDPWNNVGEMKNSGFELELNYKALKGDFDYELGFNFATNKNEVTNLGTSGSISSASLRNTGYVTRTMVGMPIAQFWGYKTQGLFQNQAEVNAWVDKDGNLLQPNAGPGDIRYAKDQTGGLYYGIIGNPLPKFTYGFNGQFSYKSLDLNIFFQGQYGNQIFNGTKIYTDRPDATSNMSTRMLNRWIGEGSTNDAHFPRLNAADANNIWFSDRYVEDGSYLRLKNIQLGYTLSSKLSQSFNIQKLRIYVGATNLLTFTKYNGFDPEIGTGYSGSLDLGVDRANYPQARTFLVGLNLTF
ncbi:MAG: TonB-dependent receptor [Peptostreptococcaceae bacterium]|nr:TonB-dependent receptor [Peptostreptococcaceae bacterium]